MQAARPAATKRADAHLELLRILASFLVIVNHTICYVDLRAASPFLSACVLSMQSLSKVAVPVFLMISGCTLLPKQDTLRKTLSRILRIALALVVFSLPYALRSAEPFSLKRYLIGLYEVQVTTAFWYLYAYLGILLMLPLLQRLVKGMSAQDFLYFFAVSFLVFGIWPLVVEYTVVSSYMYRFEVPLFGTHICYLLMGYALSKVPREKLLPLPVLLLVFVLSVGAHAALTWWDFSTYPGTHHVFLDTYAYLPSLLACAALFLLARAVPIAEGAARVLRWLGRRTFAVYLLSDLMLALATPLFFPVREALGVMPALLILQVVSFLCSFVGAIILTYIPGLRKLI